jgi:hypothetical protein
VIDSVWDFCSRQTRRASSVQQMSRLPKYQRVIGSHQCMHPPSHSRCGSWILRLWICTTHAGQYRSLGQFSAMLDVFVLWGASWWGRKWPLFGDYFQPAAAPSIQSHTTTLIVLVRGEQNWLNYVQDPLSLPVLWTGTKNGHVEEETPDNARSL